MSIVIKKATSDDAEYILEFLKQVGSETDNLSFGREGLPFSVESEAEYIRQMEKSNDDIMILALKDNKIVGNATLNRLPRRMSHRGEISVCVLKECWSKGIGSQLLCEIINFAKNNKFGIIDLQVRSDNLHAIHIYKKYGFEKYGTHPSFLKINNEEISFDYMYLKVD